VKSNHYKETPEELETYIESQIEDSKLEAAIEEESKLEAAIEKEEIDPFEEQREMYKPMTAEDRELIDKLWRGTLYDPFKYDPFKWSHEE